MWLKKIENMEKTPYNINTIKKGGGIDESHYKSRSKNNWR